MSVMRARHVAAGYVAVRLQRTGQETHNKRPAINIYVAGSSYRRILNYRDFQIICLPFCTAKFIEKMWESTYNQEWAYIQKVSTKLAVTPPVWTQYRWNLDCGGCVVTVLPLFLGTDWAST